MQRIHMCVDIRGVLRWPDRQLAGMFTDDDGRKMKGHEVRDKLLDCLAEGKKVLPMGQCEGFDYQTGCPGHERKSEDPNVEN